VREVFKQRLVGALILVALGVVFWPIIFVEQGSDRAVEDRRMPPPPNVDTSPVQVPDVAGLRPSEALPARDQALIEGDRQDVEPAPPVEPPQLEERQPAPKPVAAVTVKPAPKVVETPRTRTQAPVKPKIDSDGVPVAWMLQVASVSSSGKAEELKQKLMAIDQQAYVKKIRRGDKSLWRVYIGPKFEKARLEAVKPQVDAAVGVKSMVMRYYP
jgi:DedD protein